MSASGTSSSILWGRRKIKRRGVLGTQKYIQFSQKKEIKSISEKVYITVMKRKSYKYKHEMTQHF